MTMHSLTKSAIFFAVGHITQVKGTQKIADIRGLTASQPLLGWALVIGVIAIAGLPPFGVFTSEFLVLTSSFARQPLLALLLLAGLLVGFGALLLRLQGLAFGAGEGGGRGAPGGAAAALHPFRDGAGSRDLPARGRWSPGSRTWRGCSAEGAMDNGSRSARLSRPRAGAAAAPLAALPPVAGAMARSR